MQTEATFKKDSGIHAGQDRQAAPRLDCQVSKVKVFYELLVGEQKFIGD
jgi:hypothetical protein